FFSSRRRHTRFSRDWSSDVCSSDLGTGYFGFQDQGRDDRPTIQRTLEAAWSRLVGEPIKIIGAGRTDAGVHAEGQVVNFRTRSKIGRASCRESGVDWGVAE